MRERQIVEEALARTSHADQQAYLAEACAGDAALRQQVEDLLRLEQQPGANGAEPELAAPSPEVSAQNETLAEEPQGPKRPGLPFLQPSVKPGSLGRLGHYEVLQVLGQGGFGIVLKAFDDKLQRLVAIKVLGPHLAGNDTARKRFVREARAAARVRDAHVVKVFDVEEHPQPYLVMEYVHGETLEARLKRTGPLEVVDIVRIGAQVAQGLAASHREGEIHRDIKPANILLDGREREAPAEAAPSGSAGAAPSLTGVRARITDFGLARALDDAQLTQSGVITGTPAYMSPEQARGETLDQRSDLFSLGSVLYTLCTGTSPFMAAKALAVLKRVCDDAPQPIRDVNPAIPAWLTDIIGKLLAKAPDQRFHTAAEVADLLQQHLLHLQGPSLPPPTAEVDGMETGAYVPAVQGPGLSPGPRRRPWLVAGAIVVVALGGLALFFLLSRTGFLNRNNAAAGAADLAELKQVVADHDEAAGKLLHTNQTHEALARLTQALAAIDRARVSESERNGLRLGIYRQRAQVLRGLGREAEAQDDARKARPLLEEQYAAQPDNVELAGALAELLWAESGAPWTVPRPSEMHSAGGAALTLQPDGSVLASGTNSDNDVYTVTLSDLPASVWALRLELLADPSLPSKGPGRHASGNFQLAEIVLWRRAAGAESRIPITRGSASYSWTGERIEHAFDSDPETIWHVWSRTGKDHWALFQFQEPVRFGAGDQLIVRLEHAARAPGTNIGRFRVSVSGAAAALAAESLKLRLDGVAALGAAYFYHGDYARALGPLSRAVQAPSGTHAAQLLLLALAHQALKQPELARPLYDRALQALAERQLDSTLAPLVFQAIVQIEGASAADAEARMTVWSEAHELAALTAALKQNPDKGAGLWNRATWYACRGRWKEAAQDYLERAEVDPKESWNWLVVGAVLGLAGDAAEHQRLSNRLVELFRGTDNARQAEMITKIALVLPGSIQPAALPLALIEKALVGNNPPPDWPPWADASLALAAHRAGDHAKAVRICNISLARLNKVPGSFDYSNACPALSLLIRALAESKLRQPEQAWQSFAEAAELIPSDLRTLGTAAHTGKPPVKPAIVHHDWLFAECLRREAEKALFPGLAAFLAGEHKPADNAERLALVFACRVCGLPHLAAGLYSDAFAADPKLMEDRRTPQRRAAACCAARASVGGRGNTLTDDERTRWRRQALVWLHADLNAHARQLESGTPEERALARKAIRQMLWHPELAGVRDREMLARLPASEREEWAKLWANAADLGLAASGKLKVPAPEDLAKLPSAADALKRADIPPGLLIQAGRGDRNKAPAELVAILGGHQGQVYSVAISPDGKTLASAGIDKSVCLWDLATGHLRHTLRGHTQPAYTVAFSPDSKLLASGGMGACEIKLWDSVSGGVLKSFIGQGDGVSQVAYSPDGKLLAARCTNGPVLLWEARTDKTPTTLVDWRVRGGSVSFSRDGEVLASGGTDNVVHLLDVATGQELASLRGHRELIRWAGFHPDGRSLAACGQVGDPAIRIWDLTTLQLKQVLQGHKSGVLACAWRADGQLLASVGTKDGSVRLWDLTCTPPRSREIRLFPPGAHLLHGIAMTPEGRYLATANPDGTVYVLRLARQGEVPRLGDTGSDQ